MAGHQNILFACVENAGRSQMAEAFLRQYAPEFNITSAGIAPSSGLEPSAVMVMAEIGIDLGGQYPKELSDDMIANSSVAVNMGCAESCSLSGETLDWGISDPKGMPIDEVRKIRDQIRAKVLDLVASLEEK